MDQIIIHVDMDVFYASVEIRDDPALADAADEARRFCVHSGINIKDAYCHCPAGIYMHPNFEYRFVSQQLHAIWNKSLIMNNCSWPW